jgi:hypothetical protein
MGCRAIEMEGWDREIEITYEERSIVIISTIVSANFQKLSA